MKMSIKSLDPSREATAVDSLNGIFVARNSEKIAINASFTLFEERSCPPGHAIFIRGNWTAL